jgi:tetratricopeptide (TPR) repeat protein
MDQEERHRPETADAWIPEVWIEDDEPRPEKVRKAPAPVPEKRSKRSVTKALPDDVTGELLEASGARRAPRLARELAIAAQAYESGRYADAQRILRRLSELAPTAAGVRELHGLSLYRLGRWKQAKAELEASTALSASPDQLPVIADCERALGHHDAVERVFEDLRRASPGVEVLAEGRLVVAGSLADRKRLPDAIAVLSRWEASRARPKDWHLRTWYALGDLYERAGELPRARALFQRLVDHDPDFFDAAERLSALR